jgi:hypothetical protein
VTDLIRTGRKWPPAPVVAAVVLSGLVTAGFVVLAVVSLATGDGANAVFPLLIAAALGLVTFGVWRGQRGNWGVALILAAFSLVTGALSLFDSHSGMDVAVDVARVVVSGSWAALLAAPASARAYFQD